MAKKGRRIFLCMLCLFFLTVQPVHAANIDPNAISSITCQYQYNNLDINNLDVSLYYIATINEQAEFTYTSDFTNSNILLKNENASEWENTMKALTNYVKQNHISALQMGKTKEGMVSFHGLFPGLYLIETTPKEENGYRYTVSSSLITIPNLDEVSQQYIYDTSIHMKIEKEQLSSVLVEPPNTMDYYNIYLILFITVTTIAIVLIIILFNILKKERSKENEKKKENNH